VEQQGSGVESNTLSQGVRQWPMGACCLVSTQLWQGAGGLHAITCECHANTALTQLPTFT
jgi:hypothetical protein